ncbi:hypothetical protein [Sphingopyxis panaciterrae]
MTGLCLATLLAAFPAYAAPRPADVSATIAERDRADTAPRAVLLLLAQEDIETSFDVGRVANDYSGGILDGLIIRSMDKKKEVMSANLREKAFITVRPLHIALASFDVDALAFATTQAALTTPGWLNPLPFTVTRDASPAVHSAFVAGAGTPQLALVAYRYDLSPDFTQIRVTADIALARRPAAKGGKPVTVATDYYRQRITGIVQLAKRSYEPRDNVASWAADDGKRARAALTAAFAETGRLIPYALGLAPAEIANFTARNREKAFAAGLYGPLIERAADGSDAVLIWSDGLVHVRTLPEGS